MEEIKWYQSKTILSGIVSALAGLLLLFGYEIKNQGELVDIIIAGTSVISSILAIYYRIKTNRIITAK